MTGELTSRQPEEVTIGEFRMFCEGFSSSVNTVLHERPTVNGETQVTNKAVRSARIRLTGRIPADESSAAEIVRLNNMTGSGGYEVVCHGVRFRDCTVTGYSAEDNGGDLISLTVDIASPDPAETVGGEEE